MLASAPADVKVEAKTEEVKTESLAKQTEAIAPTTTESADDFLKSIGAL